MLSCDPLGTSALNQSSTVLCFSMNFVPQIHVQPSPGCTHVNIACSRARSISTTLTAEGSVSVRSDLIDLRCASLQERQRVSKVKSNTGQLVVSLTQRINEQIMSWRKRRQERSTDDAMHAQLRVKKNISAQERGSSISFVLLHGLL